MRYVRALARFAVVAAIVAVPWAIVVHAGQQCRTDSECAAAHGGDGGPEPARLVAYGCEGASGPLYAAEESDFPVCATIEPLNR